MSLRPTLVVSGGQTGADQGALRAAAACGIPTGGWAPHGWRTATGPAPWLGTRYGLREHASAQYQPRTIANLRLADATVVFGRTTTPGTRLTVTQCHAERRPVIVNPSPEQFADWWEVLQGSVFPHPVGVLHVAGNREGRVGHEHRRARDSAGNPGIEEYVFWFLCTVWGRPMPQPTVWPVGVWVPAGTATAGDAR